MITSNFWGPRKRALIDINMIPVGCLTAVLLCLVTVGTLMPAGDVPQVGRPGFDKFVHFFAFGLLSIFALFDTARYTGRLTKRLYITVALCVAAFGGLIEILQDLLQMGRSADWADFIADTIGAFLLPEVSLDELRRHVDEYNLSFKDVHGHSIPGNIRELYLNSFPADERRPWEAVAKLSTGHSDFHFTLIISRHRTVGFITWWRLDKAVYVEHFAVFPDLRSSGIGSGALDKFCKFHAPSMIILEVEPESDGEMARRRINFYKRCHFELHPEIDYIQPPYAPGLKPVRLMLMTYGSGPDLTEVAADIHRRVYGAG